MDISFALRSGIMFWLMGWYVKSDFYIPHLFFDIVSFPENNSFFPAWLNWSVIAQIFFIVPLCFVPCLFIPDLRALRFILVAMIMSSLVLAFHASTFNDATFVVSFWTALWLLWISFQSLSWIQANVKKIVLMGQAVIGMTFWGGVVGKFHSLFWNGDVIYHIFFEQRHYWPFSWIKQNFVLPTQMFTAMIVSRIIFFAEAFLAFGPVWPSRLYCVIGAIFMLMIIPFTTWRILSVLFCLLGVLRVNWILLDQVRKKSYA